MGISTGMLPHTVTKRRPAEVEGPYGGTTLDYDNPTDTDIAGFMQPGNVEEIDGRREAGVAEWRLFTNHADIVETDQVVWNSDVYDVDGPARRFDTPTGFHHLEVPLKKVDG